MTKLNASYKGFSVATRIADRLALDYRPDNAVQVIMLHSVKNMACNDQLIAFSKACGVNGKLYRASK